MVVPLSQFGRSLPMVENISRAGAEFSYTLYLVHFPFAAFLACYVLKNQRLMPGAASALVFAALLAAIILYAYAVYYLFERNTPKVRQAAFEMMNRVRAGGAHKATAD
ncbi:MAG: hypothetical protein WDN48_11200 [Pseudolabrys sp.]